jgi:hypothetical protein
MLVYDIETAKNRTIFGFKKGGDYLIIDMTGRLSDSEKEQIGAFVGDDILVGFNNGNFDSYLLDFAMGRDASAAEIFDLAQAIITGDGPAWRTARDHNARRSLFKELDLMNFTGRGGLKVHEARMGMAKVKTLPFDVAAPITDEMVPDVVAYLKHDLDATELLLAKMMPEIEVRQKLGEMFGLDLMNTGAAGAAESVILNEYVRAANGALEITDIKSQARRFQNCDFAVRLAPWVHDVCAGTLVMDLVRAVEASKFTIREGKRTGPDIEWPAAIAFDGFECAFGLGGVHSLDGAGSISGNLWDLDVASYYPHLLLADGGAPEHLDAAAFRSIYKGILDRRLEAKNAGRKLEANALKLVLNSTFGKTNEMWSGLYSPRSFLHITLSGQLALLALIHKVSRAGAVMISANTDGILFSCAPDAQAAVLEVISAWEELTGFPLERKDMAAYRRLNVNNYLALYADGELKGKGHLNPTPGLTSDPNDLIVPQAVAKFMQDGTPVADTVHAAAAARNLFLFSKVLTTSAASLTQGETVFGKVVRSYRCADCPPIVAAAHGKVGARTVATGRKVFEDLGLWPDDIDIGAYIAEGEDLIARTDVRIDNGRNRVARQIEAAGFITRGIGTADDVRSGENFAGSPGIAIDVAKRHGIAAYPAGSEVAGDLLMVVMQGGVPAFEVRSIAGLDKGQTKIIKAIEGAIFNAPLQVEGGDWSFEIAGAPPAAVADPVDVEETEPAGSVVEAAGDSGAVVPPADNDEFLRAIFGESWGDAFTVSFTTPPDKDAKWGGGPARLARGNYHREGANNYFGLSLFGRDAGGAYRRRGETFVALHALLLDDIGTKVGDARAAGWGEPTLLTETSPGNCQGIYRLAEPLTDRAMADALITMVLGAGVSDKGAGSITRVARMPIGSNTKSTLAEPFHQVVKVWAPERAYRVEEILGWLGKTMADLEAAAADVKPLSKAAAADRAEGHPVIDAFKAVGRFLKTKPNGWHDVLCPWNEEHSGGRHRDGAAIAIHDDGRWAFKCNHGSCSRMVKLPDGREVKERGGFAVHNWLQSQGQLVPRPGDPIWGGAFEGIEFPEEGEEMAGAEVAARADGNIVNMRMFGAGRGDEPAGGEDAAPVNTMVKTSKGAPVACLATAMHFLRNDRNWAGVLAHDLFSDKRMLMAPIPVVNGQKPNDFSPRPITDDDIVDAVVWFEANLKIKLGKGIVGDALMRRAGECPFDPLVDALRSLRWDGKPRLKTWLRDYCGALESGEQSLDYLGVVGERWMISAVARAMRPGCKVDSVMVFVGKQGRGKSTMARELCFNPGWFSDSIPHRLESKDAADHVRGLWIIEFAELAAMTRGEVEDTKAFISRQVEHFRPAYARTEVTYARRCVFFGSTNTDDFLKDTTGNRRFWPVNIERDINIAKIRADRDQFWAEAVARFDAGEQWHLTNEEAGLAEMKQSIHIFKDGRVDILRDKLAGKTKVHITEVCNMLFMTHLKRDQMDAANILKELGWARKHMRTGEIWLAPDSKA